MRGQLCVPAGWPLVMRRQVSGRPGRALSASPGNTNSDSTKAHRNSCKAAAVLCAHACSDAHLSFRWKNRNINKSQISLTDSPQVSGHSLPNFTDSTSFVVVWKLTSAEELTLQIVFMLIINFFIRWHISLASPVSLSDLRGKCCALFPRNQLFCSLELVAFLLARLYLAKMF